MPCYEIRTQTADMNVANFDVLVKSLQDAGWSVHVHKTEKIGPWMRAYKGEQAVEWRQNKLYLSSPNEADNARALVEVKSLYTKGAFRDSATRQGFRVYERGDKLVAERRQY